MTDSALSPYADLNLSDPAVAVDVLQRAAQANLENPLRQGSTVHLPPQGTLWMTGDLHDHGLNYQRILHLAQLHKHPDHHLILHELCHGTHLVNNCDLSIRLVLRTAALKLQFPQQVHFLQANHDLAQMLGNEILKGGRGVIASFNAGVEYIFGEHAPAVNDAFKTFVRSFNLAARTTTGILCTHSLPSPSQFRKFDPDVILRIPTDEDLRTGGSAYNMVWGRNHDFDLEDDLAQRWNVRLFIMGHQPADMGYEVEASNMLILASNHEHGVVLPLDLSQPYSRDELVSRLLPLAGVLL